MAEPDNEWTLMFFLAGDNQLAPLMVAELKAIKAAGFQRNTSVLVHFDPNELGAPTRIFNVNRERKKDATDDNIGDGTDSFVTNMVEDCVTPAELDANGGEASMALRVGLEKPDTLSVADSLTNFLGFCRENHRAKHYMLFLIGHGMVVGNDAFLPDENPVAALTLKEMGDILQGFATTVRDEGGAFELLGLHSCSMSSVEVAYQLKGTANFMIASQGLSYMGSWPYRQFLKKTLNTIRRAKEGDAEVLTSGGKLDVRALARKLFFHVLHNARDFDMAGYSADLSLCSLRSEHVDDLTVPLRALVGLLLEGLDFDEGWAADKKREHERVKDLVLLAHLKSQSYWQESYTDLYDFCKCLAEICDPQDARQKDIVTACQGVMEKVARPLVRSLHFGSHYQYSHGLSVYFPWSRPVEVLKDDGKSQVKGTLERYKEYAFTADMGAGQSWLDFLQRYFDRTQRRSRIKEDGLPLEKQDEYEKASRGATSGPLGNGTPAGSLGPPPPSGKPTVATGVGCSCPTIKNFEEEERVANGKLKRVKLFSISEELLQPPSSEGAP